MRLVTISEAHARALGDAPVAEGGWVMIPGEEIAGSIAVFKLMMDPDSILRKRYIAALPDSFERREFERPLDREQLLAAISIDIANCEKIALKGLYSALDWAETWREWKARVLALEEQASE